MEFVASAKPDNIKAEYRWWVKNRDGVSMLARDWGNNTFVWETGKLKAEAFRVTVHARPLGSSVEYEAFSYVDFRLTP